MAIVQIATGTSATTSVSATFGATPTQGNTIIVGVYANVGIGLESIAGYTNRVSQAFSGVAQSVEIFDKLAGAGESTTVSCTGATGATIMQIIALEVSGLVTSAVTPDGTSGTTSGVTSVTTLAGGSIATTNAKDYLITFYGTGGTTSSATFNNSFVNEQELTRLFVGDNTVAATGTYSTTASWTGSVRAGSVIAAYQLAPTSLNTGQGSISTPIHPGTGISNVGRFYKTPRDTALHTSPNAPTTFTAVADNDYRTVLNWTDGGSVSDATQYYRIERSTGNNLSYSEIATSTSPYYIDLTGSANTVYYYRVRAHNYYGDSGYATEQPVNTLSLGSAWTAAIQAWLYPAAIYSPIAEFIDGRTIDTLKPEYFTNAAGGVITQLNAPGNGTYAFSNGLSYAVKSYSNKQFVTVSSGYTNFHALMLSGANQTSGITTLTDFVVNNGYTGIELDFEGYGSWTDPDWTAYKTFVANLKSSLNAQGKLLAVLGPAIGDSPTYTGIRQSLYKFKYEEMAPLVDYISVLGYDNEYDYGGGSAVQPLDWLQFIVTWVISKVGWANRAKIVIGMPNYGYHATTGGFDIVLDTYNESTTYTGFSGATYDPLSAEWFFANAGISYTFIRTAGMNVKRKTIEDMGILNISVWHLGGNQWFNSRAEPVVDTEHIGQPVSNGIHPGRTPNPRGRFFQIPMPSATYTPAAATTQTIAGVARITKSASQTTTGIARITRTASATQTGVARIAIVTTKTQTGVARITVSATKTQQGVARVTATTTKTQTGVARITTTTTKTQTGVARITIVTTRTQTGVGRVTATKTVTTTGLARITASMARTQLGLARITATTTKTQTGKANITTPGTSTQTQQGKARIQVTTTRTQAGVARITISTSRTQTGKANINTSSTQTQQGKARITVNTTRTQTGVARITKSVSQTTTGKARITIITMQTITGKASLTAATTRTQIGKAAIRVTSTRTITGKANLANAVNRTIAGKARIVYGIDISAPRPPEVRASDNHLRFVGYEKPRIGIN